MITYDNRSIFVNVMVELGIVRDGRWSDEGIFVCVQSPTNSESGTSTPDDSGWGLAHVSSEPDVTDDLEQGLNNWNLVVGRRSKQNCLSKFSIEASVLQGCNKGYKGQYEVGST